MNPHRRPLLAGNWKMFLGGASGCALAAEIAHASREVPAVEVVLAPSFTALAAIAAELEGTGVSVAGQTLHEQTEGAFTGEVSGLMLAEAGATWVLVGHSERRTLFGESDALVVSKAIAALQAELTPVLCLGETLAERDQGATLTVLERQLTALLPVFEKASPGRCVLAYEPVWAIGTGRNATPAQAEEAHAFLRGCLKKSSSTWADTTRILYGGSVKPDNASDLLRCENIDGALVGGASLKAATFVPILQAAAHILTSWAQ